VVRLNGTIYKCRVLSETSIRRAKQKQLCARVAGNLPSKGIQNLLQDSHRSGFTKEPLHGVRRWAEDDCSLHSRKACFEEKLRREISQWANEPTNRTKPVIVAPMCRRKRIKFCVDTLT